jgi:hypothetical protein
MKNWKSTTSEYTPIRGKDTKAKAILARSMKDQGIPVIAIAHTLQLSKSRIYEYLREDFLAPPKPPTRQFHV